jgi:lipopolysaccharide transport system permease protein
LKNTTDNENWDINISSKNSFLNINLKKVWDYRDLLWLLVRRDFVSFYKQTIFGPIWFFIQPIFTTIVFVFIFGNLAGISTDGLPQPLFYMAGITAWAYFSECLLKTSTVLKDNAHIFGKVYFPRLIMPLSIVFSGLIKFLVQLLMLFSVIIFFVIKLKVFFISWYILLTPIIILLLAAQGLGFGMIISALTTKYRDLALLVAFGLQLLLYATPIAYPLSSLSGKAKLIISLNPVSYLIEGFRKCLFGIGEFDLYKMFYVTITSIIILFIGIIIYNKVEKNFIDTI